MIQSDLAGFGFRDIIAVYLLGLSLVQMSEAAFALHEPGRKKCRALHVNMTVSCGGFEEKVRVLQTRFGSCRNCTRANRWSLQGGKPLKDSQINELCQDFSDSYQNSYKSV